MSSIVRVSFYHSGKLIKEPDVEYVGGKLDIMEKVDTDVFSIPEFKAYLSELGCEKKVNRLFYRIPNLPLSTGLRSLDGDQDVNDMSTCAISYGFIDIYVEHTIDVWSNMMTYLMDDEAFIDSIVSQVDQVDHISDPIALDVSGTIYSQVTTPLGVETVVADLSKRSSDISDHFEVAGKEKRGEHSGEMVDVEWEWDDNIDTDDELGVGDVRIDPDIMSDIDEELKSGISRRKTLRRLKDLVFDRYPIHNQNISSEDLIFEAGMKFGSKEEVRDAIMSYAIATKRGIEIKKSEKLKVQAKCMDDCPWYIWVAPMGSEDSWQIKSFYGERMDCHPTTVHKNIDHKWLAKKLYLKINPKMKTREVVSLAKDSLGVDISQGQAKRAKKLAIEEIYGAFKSQYNMLWDYAEELKRSNPGSTVKLLLDPPISDQPRQFKRFYVCLQALKNGFRDGCRPVLHLDGCFLKGCAKGMLLVAVGRDANNSMYPIAWSVVEVENTESWMWFMELLKNDLGLQDGKGYTIISDQQKGLCTAIDELLHKAEHRFCAVHMSGNWFKKHKGVNLKLAFWRCVKATSDRMFKDALATLKRYSNKAADDLLKNDPKHWCRAFFSCDVKCDAVENNMVETFNGKIIAAREKPIISMLEDVRLYVIDRINIQRLLALKCRATIMPTIQMRINEAMKGSDQYEAFPAGNDKYQVRKYTYSCSVDLKGRTCGCGKWQLSGIPCEHACSAIRKAKEKSYQYVHECYSPATHLKIYSHFVAPINGEHLWKKTNNVEVKPPPIRPMPGRPKKARRKALVQKDDRNKVSIAGLPQKCSKCGQSGHSCKTCSKYAQMNCATQSGENIESGEKSTPHVVAGIVPDVTTDRFSQVTQDVDATTMCVQMEKKKRGKAKGQGTMKHKDNVHEVLKGNETKKQKKKAVEKGKGKLHEMTTSETMVGQRGKAVLDAMHIEVVKDGLMPSFVSRKGNTYVTSKNLQVQTHQMKRKRIEERDHNANVEGDIENL